MATVEHAHEFPSFVWAVDLKAELRRDLIAVHGMRVVSDEDLRGAADLFRAYREAVSRFGPEKRQGKRSPHIQFANANTNQELFGFVQRFGPVVIKALRLEDRTTGSEGEWVRTWIHAEQDISELRAERDVYRAALQLVSELRSRNVAKVAEVRRFVNMVVSGVSAWPKQWQRETYLRESTPFGEPSWSFTQESVEYLHRLKYWADSNQRHSVLVGTDPIRAGHSVLCELVNAFPPHVYLWGQAPVEGPDCELVGGVRPVLYYILRREYLLGGSIGICRNTDCRQLFEIERSGQEFCSDDCSRRQRQREYWRRRGKQLRKHRVLASKKQHTKKKKKKKKKKNRSRNRLGENERERS